MFLLDTNILLELLLDQEKADEVERFLKSKPREQLHISDFTLYSIGIILLRRKQFEKYIQFIEDVIFIGQVNIFRLSVQYLGELVALAQRYNLDFDDAYQYCLAELYNLRIVSFDKDFDRTDKGRITPDHELVTKCVQHMRRRFERPIVGVMQFLLGRQRRILPKPVHIQCDVLQLSNDRSVGAGLPRNLLYAVAGLESLEDILQFHNRFRPCQVASESI